MAAPILSVEYGDVEVLDWSAVKRGENSPKPRLLALHGWRSNSRVVEKQLSNLGLSSKFDVTYLNGPIMSQCASDVTVEALFDGPFFSWLDQSDWDSDSQTRNLDESHGDQLADSLTFLVRSIQTLGPFDTVYGFSQGACMTALLCHPEVLAALGQQERLFNRAILACAGRFDVMDRASRSLLAGGVKQSASVGNVKTASSSRRAFNRMGLTRAFSRRGVSADSLRSSDSSNENRNVSRQGTFQVVTSAGVGQERPAHYNCAIHIPTLHLIGLEDLLKADGERWLQMFRSEDRLNLYLKGGHHVPADTLDYIAADLDVFLAESRTSWMDSCLPRNDDSGGSRQDSGWRPRLLGAASRLDEGGGAVLPLPYALWGLKQVECVPHSKETGLRFDTQALSVVHADKTGPDMFVTIQDALGQHRPEVPAIHDHDTSKPIITYDSLLHFLRGSGNLRNFEVRSSSDVVAYACPPGAAGAQVLLTIASQCVAAPMDANASHADVVDAARQLGVTHMLMLKGEDAGKAEGFHAALEELSNDATNPVRIISMDLGFFSRPDFPVAGDDLLKGELLINQASGIGLFLRTSGSTSRPKVVPLKVGQLVQNGRALGTSLGIGPSDVCLNIMPLFHIGGISSSIMAVVATGGATLYAPPFTPQSFVELLAHAARPTWYSSVPTMHMAAYNYAKELDAGRRPRHSLRFIRSGAATLSHGDATKLQDFWGVPVLPTYAMTELMPISQPKEGYLLQHPDAVGQPVIASVCLVEAMTLKPVAFGKEGEVCISGPTVMSGYVNNPDANAKAFFVLGSKVYMRTGDVGRLNSECYLTITGRTKELIKRGGEQVSPAEVEAVLDQHSMVKKAVCFSVPSTLWGEEVGCALVLWEKLLAGADAEKKFLSSIHDHCRQSGMARFKVPTHFRIVEEGSLPMTNTKKYIRIGLAEVLGVTGTPAPQMVRPLVISNAVTGLRFILSMAVMFNHYGTNEINPDQDGHGDNATSGWARLSNMRSDWPFSVFFILAGLSLSLTTTGPIESIASFYKVKLASMQPTYMLIMLVCLVHLLAVCTPDAYDPSFSWTRGPAEGKECAATYAEMPWGLTVATTVLTYFFQLQSWFFMLPFTWYLMYYAWFSSVYYTLLAVFPPFWNAVWPRRANERSVWVLLAIVTSLFWVRSALLFVPFWLSSEDQEVDFGIVNWLGVGAYMFPPSFIPYIFAGALMGLLFRIRRPDQKHSQHVCGWIADALSVVLMLPAILSVSGAFVFGMDKVDGGFFPGFVRSADPHQDAFNIRIWSAFLTSVYVPVTLPWLYFLAVGEGVAANILSQPLLVNVLSPTAYHCYLLHQPLGQLYWWTTRNAGAWSWWRFRKPMYWFSPYALPVPWFEYPFLVSINVAVGTLAARYLDVWGSRLFLKWTGCIFGGATTSVDISPAELVSKVIKDMTGSDVDFHLNVADAGLSSIGIPTLTAYLNDASPKLHVTVPQLAACETVGDIVALVTMALDETSA